MNSPTSITNILHDLGLDAYAKTFEEEGITQIEDINKLSNEDMKEMGLSIGERNRLSTYVCSKKELTVSSSKTTYTKTYTKTYIADNFQ